MMHIHLRLHERAILIRDGVPARALGPGRYTFWRRYDVQRFDTDELTFTAPATVVAATPADWFETVRLAQGQYGVIFRDDRAVAFLRPGVHRMWRVDGNVTFHAYAEREFFYKNRRGNLSRLVRPPMVFATFSRYRKVALW